MAAPSSPEPSTKTISPAAATGQWQPWWQSLQLHDGIFKGGGGKGIVYVGALHELADANRWFRAVAGSSAGAITATLVAAGFTPAEIESLAFEGAKKVRLFLLGDVGGQPIIRTGKLRSWLDEILRAQLVTVGSPVPDDEPVRFRHLASTGIELFVVCVDVVARQPRVFGTRVTPELEVVDAVLASCAIPFAFRPGRLELEEDIANGDAGVHRLIDGGVWANYPAFIFRDDSFRARHELGDVELDRSLGFAIEIGHTDPPTARRVLAWDTAPSARTDRGAATRWLPFWFWGPGRWYLFLVVPALIIFVLIDLLRDKGLVTWKELAFGSPSIVEGLMGLVGGFATLGTFGRWVLYALIVLLCVFIVFMAILGFTLLDTGSSTVRTMMSVGTSVPYWVGAAANDRVIRLTPPPGLGTFTLRPSPQRVAACITSARDQTRAQLADLFP